MNIDVILHASHYLDRTDGLSAALLHHALWTLETGRGAPSTVEQYTALERQLRQAPIQWEITPNVLNIGVANDGLDYEFLVPENTRLDSRDPISKLAREHLNYPSLFSDLPAKASLGSTFRSARRNAGRSHQYVSLLVCREKLSSQLVALGDCLNRASENSGFGVRYIIPVWGKQTEDARWISCLAEWVTGWQRSIQVPPVTVLLRFGSSARDRAECMEDGLFQLGIPCCEVQKQHHDAEHSYLEYRAGRGGLNRVDHAALARVSGWICSGAMLAPSTWARLERCAGL